MILFILNPSATWNYCVSCVNMDPCPTFMHTYSIIWIPLSVVMPLAFTFFEGNSQLRSHDLKPL